MISYAFLLMVLVIHPNGKNIYFLLLKELTRYNGLFVKTGYSAKSPRIIGGYNALIEDHPYMVAIEYKGRQICGGSILTKNFILTAAHCFPKEIDIKDVKIRTGTSYKQTGGTLHRITKHIQHEDLQIRPDGSYSHDVALIKITPPFTFDKTRQPIRLFNINETVEPDKMGTVSGWGKTNETDWNGQLKSVEVPVLDEIFCYPYTQNPIVFCASYFTTGGKDSCTGDSGGPLVIDDRQAGIMSWGIGCADSYSPSVYVNVGYFREWIDQHLKE